MKRALSARKTPQARPGSEKKKLELREQVAAQISISVHEEELLRPRSWTKISSLELINGVRPTASIALTSPRRRKSTARV